ncbi:MAG TPA: hypothetical protein DCM64_09560 [Gammaproteobacteria bacterium]|nr:hypothetical protein [Gammaproteobacteria bacterium]MDP6733065.1 hypothetical protein [Gammaproteobacteria bacterium]HAJ76689.1 hypothetical protein [Gammaproteobacteria bacterium]
MSVAGSFDVNHDGQGGSGSEEPTLIVSSASCTVGERFSFGTIMYDLIQASGTATGPEGSLLNFAECDSWTDCQREAGEPASTGWTYESTTYVATPQTFSITLTGAGFSLYESEVLTCPTI